MDQIIKFVTAEKTEINDTENSVVGWGSRPTPDRDLELIESEAWDLTKFRKNPVLMLSHDYKQPPVGKCIWVKSDSNGLKFKAKFANTERGREIYELYKDGIMGAFSVGFKPKSGGYTDRPTETKYKGLKRVYTAVELLEVSCVSIPANSDALVEYVKSGKIKTKSLQAELESVIELIEKTEDPPEGKEVLSEEIEAKAEQLDEVVKEEVVKTVEQLQMESIAKQLDDLTAMVNGMQEKTVSETGDLSISDVSGIVLSAVKEYYGLKDETYPEVAEGPSISRSYAGIVDLYPVFYPDGEVVYYYSSAGKKEVFARVSYVIDRETRTASFEGEPVVVEHAWVEKEYEDFIIPELEVKENRSLSSANMSKLKKAVEGMRTMREEILALCGDKKEGKSEEGVEVLEVTDTFLELADTVEKIGMTVSTMNMEKLRAVCDQMGAVISELEGLLEKATKKDEEEIEQKTEDFIDLEDSGLIEIDTSEFTKSIDSAVQKGMEQIVKIDFGTIVRDTINKMKGKVVA